MIQGLYYSLYIVFPVELRDQHMSCTTPCICSCLPPSSPQPQVRTLVEDTVAALGSSNSRATAAAGHDSAKAMEAIQVSMLVFSSIQCEIKIDEECVLILLHAHTQSIPQHQPCGLNRMHYSEHFQQKKIASLGYVGMLALGKIATTILRIVTS